MSVCKARAVVTPTTRQHEEAAAARDGGLVAARAVLLLLLLLLLLSQVWPPRKEIVPLCPVAPGSGRGATAKETPGEDRIWLAVACLGILPPSPLRDLLATRALDSARAPANNLLTTHTQQIFSMRLPRPRLTARFELSKRFPIRSVPPSAPAAAFCAHTHLSILLAARNSHGLSHPPS